MQIIRLNSNAWSFDEKAPLGPAGGFGEVFCGTGDTGPVAIKRLKLTADAAAHREMTIGSAIAERTLRHVVPVLDYGQDADSDRYYLVMPICEESLQDLLNREGTVDLASARAILLDVVAGLREVGDVVHRDLKPGNILRYEGRWCVGDFGIAKFVEDSTSLQTLRESLTPLYAAPEQWLGERPTHATDVYALGCILHALLNGKPPFTGSMEDIREAHLRNPPPALNSGNPRLDGFAIHMLRKPADGRPSLERCHMIAEAITTSPARPRSNALAAAGHAVAEEEARRETAAREQAARDEQRRSLAREGVREIQRLFSTLFDEIEATADSAKRSARAITLGSAHLTFDDLVSTAPMPGRTALQGINAERTWEAVAYTKLSLRASDLERSYAEQSPVYVWSASIVFASTPEDPTYRWREVGFWRMFDRSDSDAPFALEPHSRDFHQAFSNVMGACSPAYGPFTIDGEDEDAFFDRWLHLFAKAAQRKLHRPNQLPIPPYFFQS